MDFSDICTEVKTVVFESMREDTNDYFEAVVVREHFENLTQRLTASFGMPLWPSDTRLPRRVQTIIQEFGGIRPGQTLYYSSNGGAHIIAMLWPWQDGFHTTLKIIKK